MSVPSADGFRRPNSARVCDYLLGGKDNYAADREMGEQLGRLYRDLPALLKSGRRFIGAAVIEAASELGISQFLDLGCGFPAAPLVHEVAQGIDPDAVCVYADRDPVVLNHVLLAARGIPQAAALRADVRDPGKVLGDPVLTAVVDLARPVCAILGGTLSGMDAEEARRVAAGYAGLLAPGSALVISCFAYADPVLAARIARAFEPAGRFVSHDPATVTGFFEGLRMARLEAGDVRCWPNPPSGPARIGVVIGGVGIKP